MDTLQVHSHTHWTIIGSKQLKTYADMCLWKLVGCQFNWIVYRAVILESYNQGYSYLQKAIILFKADCMGS